MKENMTEEEKKKMSERFYQKSIQDEQHTKSQKIAGELYVGKTSKFQKYAKASIMALAGIAVYTGIVVVGNTNEALSRYNNRLEQEAKIELNTDQQETFNQERDGILNSIKNAMADLEKIDANKEELKENGNYTVLGKNIDQPRVIPEAEAEGLFVLSDLEKDAIDKTVDNTIKEYKSR